MKVRVIALFAAVLFSVVSTSAEARHQHHRAHHQATHVAALPIAAPCVYDNSGRVTCQGAAERALRPATATHSYAVRTTTPPSEWGGARVIGGRHAGDPHAFCGAEASRYVFGEPKRELWPARAWLAKFARTSPAPGMAAARSHHVMILMSHVSGSDWMVHDGNSGGGLTREHVRSIAGYAIVDPHSARYASR